MLIPILLTAGILGATYAFGRVSAPAPAASNLGSGPTVPGAFAQVGDTVEVAPSSFLGLLGPTTDANATVTKVTVRVTSVTPTELRGDVVSYNAFGGPATSPSITTVQVDNVPTPPFPLSVVQRVLRNGQVVAP